MSATFVRLGCGLDIGKDHFHAAIGAQKPDSSFVVKASRKFDNTPSGMQTFVGWLAKWHIKLDKDQHLSFQVVMETTGVYHERLCEALYAKDFPVCIEVASRVKKYLQSIGQYTKTDKQDARGIARLACERKLRQWRPFSENILVIRGLVRHRKSLKNKQTRLSNQLHALQHSAHTDKYLEKSITRLSRAVKKEINRVDKRIRELYEGDQKLFARLESIVKSLPGVGWLTVLSVVAETNGFACIYSAKQLASYAGYDIIQNASGNSVRPSKISKRGNARIRQAMYMAAVSHIRLKQGPIYDFFKRIKLRNPKAYKVANVAVQRKLLLLIYTLFKNQTAYDPEYALKQKQVALSVHSELHEIVPA